MLLIRILKVKKFQHLQSPEKSDIRSWTQDNGDDIIH